MSAATQSIPSQKQTNHAGGHLALAREIIFIHRQLLRSSALGFPIGLARAWWKESGLEPLWSEKRLFELIGDISLSCLDHLGPVYGKIGQIALSRLDEDEQKWARKLQLDRLYGSWPAIPFSEIEAILDAEIPDWHHEFIVEPFPLGVASMAQVHAARDEAGREWVIKVIKPDARRRLGETLGALRQILSLTRPLRLTALGRRSLRELEELVNSLGREVELDLEKRNLDRMRQSLEQKKQKVLRLPLTHDTFCTPNILVMERFRGIPLVDVVEKRAEINDEQRRRLAKKLLQEMLVQVFEIGIFHGDPHAGNLMLLADGSVGIFDWGLTGELKDSDRQHISGILKALLLSDLEKLIDVLVLMGEQAGQDTDRDAVAYEIRKVGTLIKSHQAAGSQASLEELLEASLSGAQRLGLELPEGLLLMAKSLLTIEGLARGIDPEVSFARAAGPVILKAARPSIGEMLSMGKRLPELLKRAFSNS